MLIMKILMVLNLVKVLDSRSILQLCQKGLIITIQLRIMDLAIQIMDVIECFATQRILTKSRHPPKQESKKKQNKANRNEEQRHTVCKELLASAKGALEIARRIRVLSMHCASPG